ASNLSPLLEVWRFDFQRRDIQVADFHRRQRQHAVKTKPCQPKHRADGGAHDDPADWGHGTRPSMVAGSRRSARQRRPATKIKTTNSRTIKSIKPIEKPAPGVE